MDPGPPLVPRDHRRLLSPVLIALGAVVLAACTTSPPVSGTVVTVVQTPGVVVPIVAAENFWRGIASQIGAGRKGQQGPERQLLAGITLGRVPCGTGR